ncbi:MAG: tetratricopeptide repeat protein, partial [Candidatus Methylomirabilia bacterium]
ETYRQMSRYEEALADFTRGLELDPDHDWTLARRGEVYRQMGRYEEALADLTRATELNPGYVWALARRGEVYRQMGRSDEASSDKAGKDLTAKDSSDPLPSP